MTRAERIKELFSLAADLPSQERTGWLRSQCGDDSALFSELVELLAVEGSAPQEFLHRMAFAPDDGPSQPNRAAHLPSTIAHFRVIRLIAQGGMGAVYEAQQDQPRRTVAVKVIRSDTVSPDVLRRFRHEGDILARLQHPGIAHIHETGMADLGHGPQPYLAMEYVRGSTLLEYLAASTPSLQSKLELFAKICDAIHYAHSNGVIHRDLKPANVLVSTDGQPRIVNFGVARLQQGDEHVFTQHTLAGQIVGTLTYMSPEQVAGEAASLDTRSDIYSLGVLLFELLSGRTPYDLRGRSLAESARVILEQEPTRLGSINTVLRGDLDTIVLKALEKEKDRRYVSAADLAADIRRFLANQPISARPQTTFYLFRKFARRNRGLVIASAVAVASLFVGLIVVSILARSEAQQRRAAQRLAYRAAIGSASVMIQHHDIAAAQKSLEQTPEYLRGWEWRHLQSRLDDSLITIDLGVVNPSFAYMSADGRFVYSCINTAPRVLRTWDVSFSPPVILPDESGVDFYARNRTGTVDLRVDLQGIVRLRTLDSGRTRSFDTKLWPTHPDAGGYWYLPSDDAKRILFREFESNQIGVLDVETGARPRHQVFLEAWHHQPVFAGIDWVASPVLDRQCVEFWNFRTGQLRQMAKHPAVIETIAIAPDGASLYSGSQDSIVRRWNIQSGELVAMGHGHSNYINYIACSPDGRWLATTSIDHTVRMWDARTLESRSVFHGHTEQINSLVFSPDSTRLITIASDRSIRIWDASAAGDPGVFNRHDGYVYAVAFSPDGRRIASVGWDGLFKKPTGIRIWNVADGRPIAQVGDVDDWYFHVVFSPDSQKIAVAGTRGLSVHDATTGRTLFRRDDLQTKEHTLAFDPIGRRILVTGKMMDPETGRDLPCRIEASDQVAWSPRGNWIATSTPSGVRLWDAIPQHKVLDLKGPSGRIWAMTFSRDERFLVAASDEPTTFVWNVRDGQLAASLDCSAGGDLSAAFSPDGARLATGGRDQLIHLWDTNTWEEVAQLRGHSAYVKSLAFSPDGATLISGSGDRTIRIWDSKPFRDRHVTPLNENPATSPAVPATPSAIPQSAAPKHAPPRRPAPPAPAQ